jgi:hypothetical protein
MKFSIYRYNPDVDAKPRMQDYDIELEPTDRMLLDALVRIKQYDDSLSLRRLVSRRRVRLGCHEYQWQELAGVHNQARRP